MWKQFSKVVVGLAALAPAQQSYGFKLRPHHDLETRPETVTVQPPVEGDPHEIEVKHEASGKKVIFEMRMQHTLFQFTAAVARHFNESGQLLHGDEDDDELFNVTELFSREDLNIEDSLECCFPLRLVWRRQEERSDSKRGGPVHGGVRPVGAAAAKEDKVKDEVIFYHVP